ncbi:MAG: HEAT repeat domain-containing protein [Myxococcota bacterium]
MILFALLACDPAPEDIAKAIGSDNPVMREDGAKIAQNYDDEVVVAALVAVLADPSEQVRLNAIESLAEVEATSAVPALVQRLREDASPKVRRAAADALGRLLAKDAAPDLVAYVGLFDANDHDQLAGIWALGAIGGEGLPPEQKKLVLDVLVAKREQTTDKFVRYNASAALRTLK